MRLKTHAEPLADTVLNNYVINYDKVVVSFMSFTGHSRSHMAMHKANKLITNSLSTAPFFGSNTTIKINLVHC